MRGIDVTTYRPADHTPEPEAPVVADPDPDYEGWTDEEVAAEAEKVSAEHRRRQRRESSKRAVSAALADLQAAEGVRDGMAWKEPAGYLDAVPPGATRVYEGDLYKVIAEHPVAHSPSVVPEAWELIEENVEPVEPDPDDYPEWSPDGVEYAVGVVVTYDGDLWEVAYAHTSQTAWAPHDGYMWNRL
ncbi:carbohydrate-binding protein [Pseudactinotalea sp. Z1748]|uniref:carbohydrate-binding protein n=1 Tax=Pseudactinotalea sp. Z1748 TaxID=3413027 RepID=UPI003C7E7E51